MVALFLKTQAMTGRKYNTCYDTGAGKKQE
jgi:hypothetical protein